MPRLHKNARRRSGNFRVPQRLWNYLLDNCNSACCLRFEGNLVHHAWDRYQEVSGYQARLSVRGRRQDLIHLRQLSERIQIFDPKPEMAD